MTVSFSFSYQLLASGDGRTCRDARRAPHGGSLDRHRFIAAVASIWSAFRLWKVINLRRRIRLGFEGERHVGEALNQLMLVGYRVFHDFLITDKPRSIRNIDHIVIGPNGVFAVETKTRRKVKGENGAKSHSSRQCAAISVGS